jgi:hypothetical protein
MALLAVEDLVKHFPVRDGLLGRILGLRCGRRSGVTRVACHLYS